MRRWDPCCCSDMLTASKIQPRLPDASDVRLRVGLRVVPVGRDCTYCADGAVGIFSLFVRTRLIPGHVVSGVIDLDPTGAFEVGTP